MCFDHTGTYTSFVYCSVAIYGQRREPNIEIPSSEKLIAESLHPNQEGHGASCRLKTHNSETDDYI